MLIETLQQAENVMKDELDRLHVTNRISREICILILRSAYQIGKINGMNEIFRTTMETFRVDDPKQPTPEPEPQPEPAAPEPQGCDHFFIKGKCTHCGAPVEIVTA